MTTRPIVCLALVCCFFVSTTALAKEIQIQFVAFNEDESQILVKVEDANLGNSLQIREFGTNAIKKAYLSETKQAEQKRRRVLKRRFPKAGIVDQMGPRNRGTIMGAPDGKGGYNLLIMKDNRVGVLATIPLDVEKDNPANKAKGMLKEVIWTENGRQIVAIVTQEIKRDNGTSKIDDIHYFQYRSWDIQWLKAEEPKPGDQ